jgi:hypothetical protein
VPVIKTIKNPEITLGIGYNPMGSSDVVPTTQTPSIPVDGFRPLMTLRCTLDCHVVKYPGVACRRYGQGYTQEVGSRMVLMLMVLLKLGTLAW